MPSRQTFWVRWIRKRRTWFDPLGQAITRKRCGPSSTSANPYSEGHKSCGVWQQSIMMSAIITEHVNTEVADGVMTLTLSRVDKKNALTNAMYSAMSDELEHAEKDPTVRVVLFQGDGDSFTAGNDLADFSAQANGKDTGEPQAHRFISNLGKATRPLVAAVRQPGAGSGSRLELAAAGEDRAWPRLRDVCARRTARRRDRIGLRSGQCGSAGRRPARQGAGRGPGPHQAAGRLTEPHQGIDARHGQDCRSNQPGRRIVSRAPANQRSSRGIRGVCRTSQA